MDTTWDECRVALKEIHEAEDRVVAQRAFLADGQRSGRAAVLIATRPPGGLAVPTGYWPGDV